MSKQLHIINEESCCTTFRSNRGASNIDQTVVNNQPLDVVRDWAISDQESCPDHSILKYVLGNSTAQLTEINTVVVRYKFTKTNSEKFRENLILLMEQKVRETVELEGTEKVDESLCLRVAKAPNTDAVVEVLHEVLVSACTSSFKILQTYKKALPRKSVPWWTEELTILRKRVNAQRRKYQRTKGNDDLRGQRKAQYLAIKATYATTIKK